MANERNIHDIVKGDRNTALAVNLKRSGLDVSLTGKTVQFMMADSSGTVTRDWTAANVTVTDAPNGVVQYDFQAEDVDTAGIFFAWFRVGDGTKWDTYPPDYPNGRKMIVRIAEIPEAA